MSDGVTLDKVNVEIQSSSEKASSGIKNLITNLKGLKSESTSTISPLESLQKTLEKITNSFSSLQGTTTNFSNLTNGTQAALSTLESMDSKLGGISYMLNSMTSTAEVGGSAIENFGKEVKKAQILEEDFGETFEDASRDIAENTDELEGNTRKLSRVSGMLQSIRESFSGIGSKLFSTLGGYLTGSALFSYLDNAANYIADWNNFSIVMGDATDKARDFVKEFSGNLGLDDAQVMSSMTKIKQLAMGMGVASDKAVFMSKNLTQLSYDLAALKGKQQSEVMNTLVSGITGESRDIKQLGIALDTVSLQQTAFNLGIDRSVEKMTRAQKAQLAYYQIMTQASYAQNAYGKALLTPAVAIQTIKNGFTQLARSVGNILIPIFMSLMPVIRAVTQLLNEAAQALAALLGFKLSTYSWGSQTGGIAAGIGDIGDAADGTAKKLKGMLAPFDELNTIDFGDKGGSGNGSNFGVGDDLGIGLPGYEYDYGTNELSERVDEIKKKLEDLLPILGAIGGAIAAWKVGSSVINFLDGIGLLKNGAKGPLRVLFGLTLMITGAVLAYKGVEKLLDGEFTAKSVLETVAGSALVIGASGALFKAPVPLGIGILLTIDFLLLTTIIGWWNKYYDESKQELMKDKKKLNVGEFLTVSFDAIGKGIENALGPAIWNPIKEWFEKNHIARGILGLMLYQFDDKDVQNTLKLIGLNLLKPVFKGISVALQSIPGVGKTLSKLFNAAIDSEYKNISDALGLTFDKAISAANIDEKFKTLSRENMKSYNDDFFEKSSNVKSTLERSIGKGITDSTPAINRESMKLANNTNTKLANTMNGENAGKKLVSSTTTGINNPETNEKLNNRVRSLAATVNSNLQRNINTYDSGKKVVTETDRGLKDKKANDTINTTSKNLSNNIRTKVGSGDYYSVGKNSINGINKGFQDPTAKKSLGTTLSNLAKGFILGSLTKYLGIHSPSTVMRDEVGKFIPLGIAEGIKSTSGELYGTMNNLATEISSISQEGLEDVLAGTMNVNYGNLTEDIIHSGTVSTNITDSGFSDKVGEYCYNAIVEGFANNPTQNNVYIGNKKVYEGVGNYVNHQSNKYGVSEIRL